MDVVLIVGVARAFDPNMVPEAVSKKLELCIIHNCVHICNVCSKEFCQHARILNIHSTFVSLW